MLGRPRRLRMQKRLWILRIGACNKPKHGRVTKVLHAAIRRQAMFAAQIFHRAQRSGVHAPKTTEPTRNTIIICFIIISCLASVKSSI
jgi:hypothetical protein